MRFEIRSSSDGRLLGTVSADYMKTDFAGTEYRFYQRGRHWWNRTRMVSHCSSIGRMVINQQEYPKHDWAKELGVKL